MNLEVVSPHSRKRMRRESESLSLAHGRIKRQKRVCPGHIRVLLNSRTQAAAIFPFARTWKPRFLSLISKLGVIDEGEIDLAVQCLKRWNGLKPPVCFEDFSEPKAENFVFAYALDTLNIGVSVYSIDRLWSLTGIRSADYYDVLDQLRDNYPSDDVVKCFSQTWEPRFRSLISKLGIIDETEIELAVQTYEKLREMETPACLTSFSEIRAERVQFAYILYSLKLSTDVYKFQDVLNITRLSTGEFFEVLDDLENSLPVSPRVTLDQELGFCEDFGSHFPTLSGELKLENYIDITGTCILCRRREKVAYEVSEDRRAQHFLWHTQQNRL